MNFTIQRETLLKPLQLVCGVVERRQTLPILANVLLSVTKNKLTLIATDLEIEMMCQTNVKSEKSETITLPARKFMDICRALPEQGKLDIRYEGERVVIRSGKSRFVLSTLAASEFPNIELGKDLSSFSISQDVFKKALEKTNFAMAQQDVRYYLNGMLFEINAENIRFVATDGHRLALCEVAIDTKIKENQQIIVPRKGINELLRLLNEADKKEAKVQIGPNYIQVSTNDMGFTSKLIDGRFPDYQNVVPTGGDKEVICDRESLRQALGRVSILSNEKYRGVRLQFSQDKVSIFAHNPEQEEAEEELTVDYSGGDLEIGFNVSYMLDAIAACSADQVQLLLTDTNSCCLIQNMGDESCKYVVMPMRL